MDHTRTRQSGSTNNSSQSPSKKKWEFLFKLIFVLQSISIIVVFEKFQLKAKEEIQLIHGHKSDDNNNDGLRVIAEDVEGRPLPFSFSACLLIKDNNILLPEWLAYHYTFLPLRRLIVMVDPLSHTDPKPIFDAYESIGLNTTIWMDDWFWVDGAEAYEKRNYQITNDSLHDDLANRCRYRQRLFYGSCMQQLHDEKRTWTLIADTDEYLAFNHYDEKEGPPVWCKKNATCEQEYAKSIHDGSHIRTKFDQSPSATVAEHIDKHGADRLPWQVHKPCIIYGRYLFVSKESSGEEIRRGIDSEFNTSLFHTLRYRYRAPLSSYQLGKCMVDVSRYDGREVPNPHRIMKDLCTG